MKTNPNSDARDIASLEARLQSLEPAEFSKDLEDRLLDGLTGRDSEEIIVSPEPSIWSQGQPILKMVAALVFLGVIGAVLLPRRATQDSDPGAVATAPDSGSLKSPNYRFEPSARHVHFLDAQPGSVSLNQEGQPVREVQYRYLDAQQWVEQDTGSIFRFAAPRTEKVVEPVQVF